MQVALSQEEIATTIRALNLFTYRAEIDAEQAATVEDLAFYRDEIRESWAIARLLLTSLKRAQP